MKKPLALIIMDGYGKANSCDNGNAICGAKTPNLDKIFSECPVTYIGASGLDVGLPDGQMGNSEVGHTNIGAGRVVFQELVRISNAIKDGSIENNEAMIGAIENCKKNDSAFHLVGLVSEGGVHSHIEHLLGLIDFAGKSGLKKVFVHVILDGRDVSVTAGKTDVARLYNHMQKLGVGKIASIMGRFYAMDRDFAWDRVEKAYSAMVYGEGEKFTCPVEYIENSYANNVTDEFVIPAVCEDGEGRISANDSVVFFNFRPDRARQITRTFVDESFDGFERKTGFQKLYYVCMTQYDATMPNVEVAFKPAPLTMTFGEFLSVNNMTQLRIAETQKYAHVTFFFNGGEETTFEGEDRALIQSPNVETFDMKPEMSAYEVCDEVVSRINSGKYDVIILNYANCDMVGHTGVYDAAVAAVEAVDECVGKTIDAILKMGGSAIVTADHGNAEKMIGEDGAPFTPHTTNPVPFAVIGYPCELKDGGKLADICPTMIQMLCLTQPKEMTGTSLIK